jgi:hypothetical protein
VPLSRSAAFRVCVKSNGNKVDEGVKSNENMVDEGRMDRAEFTRIKPSRGRWWSSGICQEVRFMVLVEE